VKLNLGCGPNSLEAPWVNVDIVAAEGVDVVHDLERAPWPWKDGTAEGIAAVDIFEHIAVRARITFMTECHRILEPGGLLQIQTTYWRSWTAFTDPTHTGFFTEHTFDYWIPGTTLYRNNAFYGGVSFEPVMIRKPPPGTEMVVILRKPAISGPAAP